MKTILTRRLPAALLLGAMSLLGGQATAQLTLTTTMVSNNGGNVGGAVHFDLTVLNPAGVLLTRFDVNASNPRGTPAFVDVYMTDVNGTYVGNQVNPAPGVWSLRASAPMVTAGTDAPTIANFPNPIPLAAGTYGVTVVYRGCAGRYTGTATVPPTQTTFSSGDLRIDTGTAQNTPFVSAAFNPRVANVIAHYSVLAADVCAFSADVTSGNVPLIATFTDRSVTPSGPVVAWDWDFDGDNVTDATTPSALFVYASCGDYPVRLRITTPAGVTTTTWNNHVSIDPLVANFTPSASFGTAPLVVQFTDTSSPTATTWAWDFDGDGLADSTQQNPVYAFGPGAHAVTLTAINGCRAEQVTKRITVATDTFATGGAPNSFVNVTAVAMFDLTVTAAEALSICAIDFRSYTPEGNPMRVDIYLTDTGYAGKITSPGEWRHVATATGTTPAVGQPCELVLDRPILMLPGRTYGVGLHHIENSAYYVNLTVPVSNADFTMTPGAVAYSPNGPFTNAAPFSIRQWVGNLHYNRRSLDPQGVTTWFASGCPGQLGVPTITPVGTERPVVGSTTNFTFGALPQNVSFLLLGFSDQTGPLGPLPQDLSIFGAPGCALHVSPDVSSVLIGAGNTASWAFATPNSTAFAGIVFFAQGLALSPGTNALGGVTSDAVGLMLGTF